MYIDREWGRRSRERYLDICATRRAGMFYPSRVRRNLFDFEENKAYRAIACDCMVKIWNLVDNSLLRTLETDGDSFVICVAVSADGTRAICGGYGGRLRVYYLIDGTLLLHTLEGHTKYVQCCDVSADGTRAISGSNDTTLKVWNLVDGTLRHNV